MSRLCRHLLVAVGLLAGLLLVSGVVCLREPGATITPENAARIQEGMTLAEVEAVLGGPPGDDAGAWIGARHIHGITRPVARDDELHTWRGPQYVVTVAFDSGGHAIDYALAERSDAAESMCRQLRRWLGL